LETTAIQVKEEGNFKFVDEGKANGDILILLHGLFGALSNFNDLLQYFSKEYRVLIPLLPIYTSPKEKTNLEGLLEYLLAFIEYKNLKQVVTIGNSLGGHLALKYALADQSNNRAMVLTGSSGLYEEGMGEGYPKKEDYEYVKEKTEYTFYDPKTATKELVDEVFNIVNDRGKALSTIYMARSAIKDNLREKVPDIKIPSLLIWGKQDTITPPFVATEFEKLLPNAQLKWIDKCGHAPMMEHPATFNTILGEFLKNLD